jgi:hypothetical protein
VVAKIYAHIIHDTIINHNFYLFVLKNIKISGQLAITVKMLENQLPKKNKLGVVSE